MLFRSYSSKFFPRKGRKRTFGADPGVRLVDKIILSLETVSSPDQVSGRIEIRGCFLTGFQAFPLEPDLVHHKIGQVYHFRVFFRDGDGIRSTGKIIFYGKLQTDGLMET